MQLIIKDSNWRGSNLSKDSDSMYLRKGINVTIFTSATNHALAIV